MTGEVRLRIEFDFYNFCSNFGPRTSLGSCFSDIAKLGFLRAVCTRLGGKSFSLFNNWTGDVSVSTVYRYAGEFDQIRMFRYAGELITMISIILWILMGRSGPQMT